MATSDLLTTVANNVLKVYEAGKKDGKQGEHDVFWDVFQNYGNENGMAYGNAFGDDRFTDANYNPKYPIITENVSTAANTVFGNSTKITDTKVPFICKGSKLNQTFARCGIEKIVELNVHKGTAFDRTFYAAGKIRELNVTGTIGKDGFDIHWSLNLNKASIESIINALSATTSGLTVTLSAEAVNNAFTADEWEALEATKTNWTISLV